VAGSDAAMVRYSDGTTQGLDFVVMHDNGAYFGRLTGSGGLDVAAVEDILGVLGSWKWTSKP